MKNDIFKPKRLSQASTETTPDLTADDKSAIDEAIDKNDSLIQFFFKTLYVADKQGFIRVEDLAEKDLQAARSTFEYLTLLLPFL